MGQWGSCSKWTSFEDKHKAILCVCVYALGARCKPWSKGRAQKAPWGNLIRWIVAWSTVNMSLMKGVSVCTVSAQTCMFIRAWVFMIYDDFDQCHWWITTLGAAGLPLNSCSVYIMWYSINSISHVQTTKYTNKLSRRYFLTLGSSKGESPQGYIVLRGWRALPLYLSLLLLRH